MDDLEHRVGPGMRSDGGGIHGWKRVERWRGELPRCLHLAKQVRFN
jgi:hypothetical protein